jgi:HEAT repeat protein
VTALQDVERTIRQLAAVALGEVGAREDRARAALCTALRDIDTNVRWAAATALQKLGTVGLDHLLIALQDKDWNVRQSAAWALGNIPDTRTIVPLAAALQDKEIFVRITGKGALRKIGSDMLLRYLDANIVAEVAGREPEVEEILIAALRNAQVSVRRAAAVALEAISWQPATAAERAAYAIARGDWSATERLGAVALDPLFTALRDCDGTIRQSAAKALGAVGDWRAGPYLRSALLDVDAEVRMAAASALCELGGRDGSSDCDSTGQRRWGAAGRSSCAGGP